MARRPLALVAFVALAACNPTPEDNTVKSIVASPTAHPPRTFLVPGHSALGESRLAPTEEPMPGGVVEDQPAGELQWKKPDAWEDVPSTSAMRIATYRIHHVKGDTDDAEMSVTRVGGDVESNISRWVGQFQEKPTPARKEFNVSGLKLTVVKLLGTYTAGGMPGGTPSEPKPDTALLAIIVEAGGDPYFFKLTGPKATVEAAKEDFGALTQSFRLGSAPGNDATPTPSESGPKPGAGAPKPSSIPKPGDSASKPPAPKK